MKHRISKSSDMVRQLTKLRNDGWEAIIAGGAIRDTFHDKEITDVDIFVQINEVVRKRLNASYKSKAWLEYWFKAFGCNLDKNDDVTYLGGSYTFKVLDTNIQAVWQILTAGKKYQIILLNKDPITYVKENFDFGICRAYCDGRKLHFTNEFMHDTLNHTITLYRENLTDEQINYALGDHVARIQKKFPGWTLMDDNPMADED